MILLRLAHENKNVRMIVDDVKFVDVDTPYCLSRESRDRVAVVIDARREWLLCASRELCISLFFQTFCFSQNTLLSILIHSYQT